MKTLTTVNWVSEADALCVMLESHGIETFLPDENTVQVNPLYGGALGGVRVQVRDEAYEQALEIAREWMRDQSHSLHDCPACGSFHVHYQRVSRRMAFLSILLLGFPLLFIRKRYVCEECGHTWSPSFPADET